MMLILFCVIEGHLKLRHILYSTLYVLMLPSLNEVVIVFIREYLPISQVRPVNPYEH